MTDQASGSAVAGNSGSTSAVVAQAEGTSSVTNTQAAATTQASSSISWLPGADEVTVGYVQNKGWSDPAQVLDGYRNLEKVLGADRAGRTVVLPGEKAEQAEIDAFYSKLGRPAEAKDYKVDVPAGAPPEYADGFRAVAHQLGLTSKQAEGLVKWNNEFAGNAAAAQQNQSVAAFQADSEALKQAWGAAHDQNVVVARNTVAALGLDNATIDKMSAAIGHKPLMELLHKIGAKTGEGEFVSGSGSNYGSALTPAQAKSRIEELRRDNAWTTKYLSKDADAMAEMSRLMKYAYPEG